LIRRRESPIAPPKPLSNIQIAAGNGTGVVANSAIAKDSLPAESAAAIVTELNAAPAANEKNPEGKRSPFW
jgi:hypothetical protein